MTQEVSLKSLMVTKAGRDLLGLSVLANMSPANGVMNTAIADMKSIAHTPALNQKYEVDEDDAIADLFVNKSMNLLHGGDAEKLLNVLTGDSSFVKDSRNLKMCLSLMQKRLSSPQSVPVPAETPVLVVTSAGAIRFCGPDGTGNRVTGDTREPCTFTHHMNGSATIKIGDNEPDPCVVFIITPVATEKKPDITETGMEL